jgi:hypothetical protein
MERQEYKTSPSTIKILEKKFLHQLGNSISTCTVFVPKLAYDRSVHACMRMGYTYEAIKLANASGMDTQQKVVSDIDLCGPDKS